jgi:hypothetical protein
MSPLLDLLHLSANTDRMLPATEREESLRERKGTVPLFGDKWTSLSKATKTRGLL